VRGRRSARSHEAARTAGAHAAARLDAVLVAPLSERIGRRPLVIVPTGLLHAVPWTALPSLQGRPLAVSPSACVWHVAARRPAKRGAVLLVAGPGLPGAADEIRELGALYPAARQLAADDARCDSVLDALDGVAIAHVAAHGRFRADNPLFSALRLADGPVTVYDLEGLRQAPQTLVLSACDSALSAIRPGDELMGLSAALLALGARTLVASILPVSDDHVRALMRDLHRGLVSGRDAAEALAEAQERARRSGAGGAVAAAALVCIGA
jgi:CHAT domain-containing protein